jgi:hypothetical protein
MLGKMHYEIVAAFAQRGEQLPLVRETRERTRLLPIAPHYMDSRDRRVQVEHLPGLGIDERVNLQRGRMVLENREYGRGQENVAVVAQLDHQRSPQAGNVDRVCGAVTHGVHDSRPAAQRQPRGVCICDYLNACSALAKNTRPACG